MESNSKLANLNTFEFLKSEIYLPEYVVLREADFDKKGGTFAFIAKEPLIARSTSQPNYLTLKGLPLCLSQAAYAIGENLVKEGLLGDLEIMNLRKILSEGRIRIPEVYERFRRQVKLGKPIQGRFDIAHLRLGKKTLLKLNYDFENNSIEGNFISIITNTPNPPMNYFAARS